MEYKEEKTKQIDVVAKSISIWSTRNESNISHKFGNRQDKNQTVIG